MATMTRDDLELLARRLWSDGLVVRAVVGTWADGYGAQLQEDRPRRLRYCRWPSSIVFPPHLSLDTVHEIEATLSDEEWDVYMDRIYTALDANPYNDYGRCARHAPASVLAAALVEAIRGGE